MAEIIGRRRKRERSYVSIENSMFEDARLSYRAKGVLGYLLSKPDDWTVRIADLTKKGKEGRDAIYKALTELREFNYLHFYQPKNEKGHWSKMLWEYDDIPFDSNFPSKQPLDTTNFEPFTEKPYAENQEPVFSPLPEKPYPEKPYPENQETLIKNDFNKKDFNKKELNKAKALADKIISKNISEKEGIPSSHIEILKTWDFTAIEITEILNKLKLENLSPDDTMMVDQCKLMFDNPQVTGSKVGYFVNGIRYKIGQNPKVVPIQPQFEEAPRLSTDSDQLKALLDKVFPEQSADVQAIVRRVFMKFRFQLNLLDFQIILNEFKPKINQSRNGNIEAFLVGFVKNYLNPVTSLPVGKRKSTETESAELEMVEEIESDVVEVSAEELEEKRESVRQKFLQLGIKPKI